MLVDDYLRLTGLNCDYLTAATAGAVAAGDPAVSHFTACPENVQILARAATIVLARLANALELDGALRLAAAQNYAHAANERIAAANAEIRGQNAAEPGSGGEEYSLEPIPTEVPPARDDDGCVYNVPVGHLREAARVLEFAKRMFGEAPRG